MKNSHLRKSLYRQKGMSFPLLVILILFAAFVGMFALKVGPTYLDYLTVTKIVDETAANANVMSQPRSKVLVHIDKAYRTNNLWDYSAKDTVVIEKDGKRGYKLNVDYEKRSPLFANIEVVTVFKKTAGTP